ncbi:hypothetical protein BT96DRAFT_596061 [Gymnopus androsaceus JB14]|uniref:Uncharacterized protein n=1 Tax=Gymnopus androsaceus JB14 TaxID=1447944 RepID=A0A6A4HXX9_9AGAR|nr:hypothetical protein BT96DRAFT_596061 [Gymnopus androsaceus JB14]
MGQSIPSSPGLSLIHLSDIKSATSAAVALFSISYSVILRRIPSLGLSRPPPRTETGTGASAICR